MSLFNWFPLLATLYLSIHLIITSVRGIGQMKHILKQKILPNIDVWPGIVVYICLIVLCVAIFCTDFAILIHNI